MLTLQIDKREKYSRRKLIKDTIKNVVTLEETVLPLCDYIVEEDGRILFGIEWKTYEDYVNSITNGHLKSQISDMDLADFPTFIILTGNYVQWSKYAKKFSKKGLSKGQIEMFTVSIAGRHKTKLIHVDTESEGVGAILTLITIHKGGRSYEYKLPERKKYTGDIHVDMLLSIPGIGPKKAKEIRESFTFYHFIEKVKKSEDRLGFKSTSGVLLSQSVYDYIKKL